MEAFDPQNRMSAYPELEPTDDDHAHAAALSGKLNIQIQLECEPIFVSCTLCFNNVSLHNN